MYKRALNNLFIKILFSASLALFFSACKNKATKKENPPQNITSVDTVQKAKKPHVRFLKEKQQKLAELYQTKVKDTQFNGCVLIAQNGTILYSNAFGYKKIKTKTPLTLNTAFQLASTSKPLTAAGILVLVQKGLINLNDKVKKYIPKFPYADITIQMLLNHRSGIKNYLYFAEDYCDKQGCYKKHALNNDDVIEIINTHIPEPYNKAGKQFNYCNTNYALLASIIEIVSKQTFASYMKENVFMPLGMNNTWVHSENHTDTNCPIAIGHLRNGRLERNKYADNVVGDKGIYSTVEDLFKWDKALYGNKILSDSIKNKAFKGYSYEYKGKRNYGLGWRITEFKNGEKDIYHNGWWHGFNATFYRQPTKKITIIALSNRANKSAFKTNDILKIINDIDAQGI